MSWRVARSLDVLLGQLDATAPRRSKASDGAVGDTEHQSRSAASDHNPWYPKPNGGIVTARDFTHDPAGGMDCNWLAATLVASRDSRIKYVIWNNRIIDSRPGNRPWQWVAYNGVNPHTKHLHVSVMDNASCDDPRAWNLGLEDDMALSQDDINRVADAVWNTRKKHLDPSNPLTLEMWVWVVGANMGAWGAANRPIPTADIDEQALAAELAEQLLPPLQQTLRDEDGFDEADAERLAATFGRKLAAQTLAQNNAD